MCRSGFYSLFFFLCRFDFLAVLWCHLSLFCVFSHPCFPLTLSRCLSLSQSSVFLPLQSLYFPQPHMPMHTCHSCSAQTAVLNCHRVSNPSLLFLLNSNVLLAGSNGSHKCIRKFINIFILDFCQIRKKTKLP